VAATVFAEVVVAVMMASITSWRVCGECVGEHRELNVDLVGC
jgi:hypothetical protein